MEFKKYNVIDKETGIMYQTEAIDKTIALSNCAFVIIKNNWKTTKENLLLEKNKKVLEFLMSNVLKRLMIVDFN